MNLNGMHGRQRVPTVASGTEEGTGMVRTGVVQTGMGRTGMVRTQNLRVPRITGGRTIKGLLAVIRTKDPKNKLSCAKRRGIYPIEHILALLGPI